MFNIHFKLTTMALLWATSYPLGRYLAAYEAPQAIIVVRAFTAFAFLAVVASRRGELRIPFSWALVGQIAVLGFCTLCVHNFLLFKALEYTDANTGAVINGAMPVVVMLLDYAIFRRTIARWSVLGIAISFVGATIVITHGEVAALLRGQLGYGEFLFLIAICAWALYTIIARPLLARYPATSLTAYSCLSGGLLMLPAAFYNLEASVVLLADPALVLLVAMHGILTLGLGFLWYYQGIRELGPMNASVYTNLVPIFAVILAASTIGELPENTLIFGATLVIGGLWLVNRVELRRGRRSSAARMAA